MIDKMELLSQLREEANQNTGTVQMTFSPEASIKSLEISALRELESDGYIHIVAMSIGYAICQVVNSL